jgi:hypothetical protein
MVTDLFAIVVKHHYLQLTHHLLLLGKGCFGIG